MKCYSHFLHCLVICSASVTIYAKEIKWDWTKIDYHQFSFPTTFLWGCADSAIQTEGVITAGGKEIKNSWTDFEEKHNWPLKVGNGCERWTRYKEDIALLAQAKMNAYRFNIDWSKTEPEEGKFDDEVIAHYADELDELQAHNITPFVVLFHHVVPCWFAHKEGFERAENNFYFVRFVRHVFERLHKKATFWILLNEPVAFALEGYFRGHYPPGKKSLLLTGQVTLNLLNAHVQATQEIRALDVAAKVGIAHMCQPIDSYSRYNPIEKIMTKFFSYLVNETTITFFKTGRFQWAQPWALGTNSLAPQSLDFIGINYYTHTTIKQVHPFKMVALARPDEKVIDFNPDNEERAKVLYPEGLYRSIVRVATLGLPIYITENGASTEDPALKEEFIRKHLYVISRAIQEGYDIRGYFYWTLVDCYSWTQGYAKKHGLYDKNRVFKPFMQFFIDIINQFSQPV